MRVFRAKVLGFCTGVRRARDTAAEEAKKARVYTLGPLVHNPRVLDELRQHGIEDVNELPKDLTGCTVVIRAHGISPVVEKKLRAKSGVKVTDATCPKVKKSQEKARELAKAGYCIFLAGEAKHAEIEGILGYAQCSAGGTASPFCAVVGNAKEAAIAAQELYKKNTIAKTALLGQTTISREEYREIGEAVKKYFPDLKVIDTICAATIDRQDSLRELLDKTDGVIIAGGKESANTRRLLAIAKKSKKPCALVETAGEIPPEFFKLKKTGISAGASTPESVIDEIEKALLGEAWTSSG